MKWQNTSERFIAFFDIMGFKNLVLTQPHEQIELVMKKINNQVFQMENEARRLFDEDHADFFDYTNIDLKNISAPKEKASRDALNKKSDYSIVRPVIFSDSILLITNTNTVADAIKISIASMFVIETCMLNGLPVKGALTFGKFTADFDNSIYFGQPLVDAYLLQEGLFMYGAVCHHTFEKFLKENHIYLDSDIQSAYQHLLSVQDVPFKSKTVKHIITNIMGRGMSTDLKRETILKLYDSVSGEIRKYVDNTVKMFDSLSASPPSK